MDFIDLLKYIFFGLIQGVFEVLPISSSGQVSFLQYITGEDFENRVFFLIIVNIGSLLAIIIYLFPTIKKLVCEGYKRAIKKDPNPEYKKSTSYLKNLLIGIIPIGVLGFIANSYDFLYGKYLIIIIGIGSLLTATILYLARGRTDLYTSTRVNYNKSLYIGLAQLLAIIPGVSRLAITTAAGTRKQLSYDTSLTFSLLMYIPISIGTIIVAILSTIINYNSILDFDTSNFYTFVYYFVAAVVSFFATFLALKLIFIITKKGKFKMFFIYNLVFGLIAFIMGVTLL